MSERKPLRRADGTVIVTAEDLDRLLTEGLDEIQALSEEFGRQSQQARDKYLTEADDEGVDDDSPSRAAVEFQPGRVSREEVAALVRAYLEDAVQVLPAPDQDVNEHDRDRALALQALVRLKRPALEAIVRAQGGTPRAGSARDVATQVAVSYEWDPSAIARLVLDHTEEPNLASGGFSTRLFYMRDEVDFGTAARRLRTAMRRFIPVGPVRWFVFDTLVMSTDQQSLDLEGRLRTFRPVAVEGAEHAELGAKDSTHVARIQLRAGNQLIRVLDATDTTTARAAMRAFELMIGEHRRPWVSGGDADAQPIPGRLHPQTEMLLDVATNRLPETLFERPNAVLARFRISASSAAAERNASADTPSVSAWRAEGRHLLDSPSACGLMLTEGRPLVDLTLNAGARSNADSPPTQVTTRFALETDHVLVETGLVSNVELAKEVHATAVRGVEDVIMLGVDMEAVAALAPRIAKRARGEDTTGTSVVVKETTL